MDTKKLLNKIADKQDLTTKESAFILERIIKQDLSSAQASAFLTALRVKGESTDELVGLIQAMRSHMVSVEASNGTMDIVGSGGDGQNSFNISTTAALVCAGAGVKIAKHGNRAASSLCGSADVLESLGVNINLTADQASEVLQKVGIVFLFAPLYHPAMKIIGPIRKELGFRTVFNFLGPFLNPAHVKYALIGMPAVSIAEKFASVSKNLGFKSLIVFSSHDGMDEISTTSPTSLFIVKSGSVKKRTIQPSEFGLKTADRKEFLGGDKTKNAHILREILQGQKGAKRDIVLLNSAFALFVSGKAKTVKEGIVLAEESIDSGKAMSALENLIAQTKKYV